MNVDWPTVFEGIKTVLDPLSNASWPITMGVIAWVFRDPVKSMISRVRQLSGFGGTADFTASDAISHQQSAKVSTTASLSAPADTNNFPPSDPVYDILDRQLETHLDQLVKGGDNVKLAWAIRQRSVSEATRIHEANYRVIFGSQIHALKTLNVVGTGAVSEFESFYETVRSNPAWEAMHKDRTFEQWGQFLIGAAYVVLVEDSDPKTVQITPFGKQFLQWMVLAGVPDAKPG
jgi:hypothetical protein